jgi:hypothetical protein
MKHAARLLASVSALALSALPVAATEPPGRFSAGNVDWATIGTNTASFEYEVNVKNKGAKGDGVTDDGPAFAAAIAACPTAGGCAIFVPNACPNYYRIATGFTLPAHDGLLGEGEVNPNINQTTTCGAMLKNASGGPMITFPGSTSLTADVSVGEWLSHVVLDGGNLAHPVLYAPEQNPGRGTFGAALSHVAFQNAQGCFAAYNAWDWSGEALSFVNCGNIRSGVLQQTGDMYFFNSAQTYGGATTNSGRFNDIFLDTSPGHGRGIIGDSSGAGGPIEGMVFTNVHSGTQGQDSLYGCFNASHFEVFSEGSTSAYPIFNLFAPGGRGGCGGNRFDGSVLTSPGQWAIMAGEALDHFSGITIIASPSSGNPYIYVPPGGYFNTITGVKTWDTSCCNNTALLSDKGTGTTAYNNDGSDGLLSAGLERPSKLNGVLFQEEYSAAVGSTPYTATISCSNGQPITTLGTVVSRGKKVGNLAYAELAIAVTALGSCGGNLEVTLPFPAVNAPANLSGRDNNSGVLVAGSAAAGTSTLFITNASGALPIYNGASISLSGWYEWH